MQKIILLAIYDMFVCVYFTGSGCTSQSFLQIWYVCRNFVGWWLASKAVASTWRGRIYFSSSYSTQGLILKSLLLFISSQQQQMVILRYIMQISHMLQLELFCFSMQDHTFCDQARLELHLIKTYVASTSSAAPIYTSISFPFMIFSSHSQHANYDIIYECLDQEHYDTSIGLDQVIALDIFGRCMLSKKLALYRILTNSLLLIFLGKLKESGPICS